jgi:murein L,D-transpeptidase YcbB/YkuD
MIKISSVLFSIIFLISFYGCDDKTEKVEPGLNEQFKFNLTEYENVLRKNIIIPDTLSIVFETCGKDLDTIKYFYSTQNIKPIFLKSFESQEFVDSLLNILEKADEHGLNPETYHYSIIKGEFYELLKPNLESNKRYFYLANAELLIADAILKYSSHMRHGVFNPREIYPDSYFIPIKDSLNKQLFEPFKQNHIIQYLYNIQPKSDKYKKLQSSLKRFESLKNMEWITIPIPNKKIGLGQSFDHIDLVTSRLITLGFLDTNKVKLKDFTLYDSLLVEPIKNFQKANGFNGDGVIDKSTIERLNITPEEYLDKIKLTLERFRWIDYSDIARYILVNIPDFKLSAVENRKELFNIVVCAGRKGEWETPNLYGEISYLVLNPTWSVPKSIIQEEIVSGLRKDSLYLKKRNFKVYKSGQRVSLDGLTARDLSSSKQYTVIQDPGLGNALGKIKFMFNNPFGVYLHDTPTRAPFKYVNRAVSHGCVRVEKPIQFAEYLLANNSRWTTDYIKIEIGQKVEDQNIVAEFTNKRSDLRNNFSYGVTTEVRFDNKIPLFIDYYTVWVDEGGIFNLRDDVYGRDKILMEYFQEVKLAD